MKEFPAMRMVIWSRMLRPMIDLALLVCGLLACVWLQAGAGALQSSAKLDRQVQQAVRQHASRDGHQQVPVLHDQQFGSEQEMWQHFRRWRLEKANMMGQCRFDMVTGEQPYRLQCSGVHFAIRSFEARHNNSTLDRSANPEPQSQQQGPMPTVLVPGHPSPGTEPGLENAAANDTTDPAQQHSPPSWVVKGWVDTRSGRVHFNPTTNRWSR